MSGIRLGDIPDIKHICNVAEELLNNSAYAGIKPDEMKFKKTVASMMAYKSGLVLVVVDDDNIPQGFLLGMVEELFFSKEQYSTDLAFYVREGYRGYVPKMLKRFIKWSKNKPKVSMIMMAVTSGIGDHLRIGKLYEKLGFNQSGSYWIMRT